MNSESKKPLGAIDEAIQRLDEALAVEDDGLVELGRDILANGREIISSVVQKIDAGVRENPWPSILVAATGAFGLGLMVGKVISGLDGIEIDSHDLDGNETLST